MDNNMWHMGEPDPMFRDDSEAVARMFERNRLRQERQEEAGRIFRNSLVKSAAAGAAVNFAINWLKARKGN